MDNYELTLSIQSEPQATLNLGVAEGATDEASARTAEAYAKGTRNGVPVEEGDPAYHNNAKYYRDSAAAIAAGDVIDDDAGAGDYDLTWSADKLTSQKADIEELESSKADAIDVQIDTPASVMTFSDGGNGYPMSATFEIAPVQSGSGDPAPDNVRPITGWTGAKISRTGKNLIPTGTDTSNGYKQYYYIGESGTEVSGGSSSSYYISEYFTVKAGVDYTLSFSSATVNSPAICFYDSTKTYISGTKYNSRSELTVTAPANAVYCRVSCFTNRTCMLEFGNNSTEYEDFKGSTTYPISFPAGAGTVYGGTLTVNKDGTGKLVVDKGILVYDGVNTKLNLHKQGNVCYVFRTSKPSNSVEQGEFCNKLKTGGASTDSVSNGKVTWYAGIRGSYVYADTDLETITTQEQFDAWCQQESLQIVYRLSTPTEYTLTASEVGQILSLLGTNNLFCDTGNVLSVDYTADTKLYVEKQISASQRLMELIVTANREDTMKATKAYSSGDLMIVNATLYKATTSIANGATLTVGTNVTATTVADEIAALA